MPPTQPKLTEQSISSMQAPSTTDGPPGGLSDIILQFIDTASLNTAYTQRSHKHTSLLNAYIVAVFLQGSTVENISPLKRNAGLRDLSQKLHIWPGDIAMDLRRDALIAIELLERYVQESLASEMRYVEGVAVQGPDTPVGQKEVQIPRLALLRHEAVVALEGLMARAREKIRGADWEAAAAGLELNDLVPYIPFFDGTRDASAVVRAGEDSGAVEMGRVVRKSGLTPARADAAEAVEDYRQQVGGATEQVLQYLNSSDKSSKGLRGNMSKLSEIHAAHELMTTKLAQLLEAEGNTNEVD